MDRIIYGVDTQKPFGPKDVLEAVERCFAAAHKDVLAELTRDHDFTPEQIAEVQRMDVRLLVKKFIEEAGGDYDAPTKAALSALADKLRDFALNFRKPWIVRKHYGEIRELIALLKE